MPFIPDEQKSGFVPDEPGKSYGQKVLEDLGQTANALLNPMQILKGGMNVGKELAHAVSTGDTSGIKQMGTAVLDPILHPIRNIQEGKLASTAVALAPGVGLAGKVVKGATGAILPELARRGLGYTAKDLVKPGTLDKATEIGMASLEKGVMPISGNVRKALNNAEGLAEKSGKRIEAIRQEVGASVPPSFDILQLTNEIRNQIAPELLKTDLPILETVIKNIEADLPWVNPTTPYADFMKASKLVRKLQEKGNFKALGQASEAKTAEVYARASGIARQMLDDAVEKAGAQLGKSKLIKEYIDAKKSYSQAQEMIPVLSEKMGKVAGNMSISPITALLGGGAAGFHNPYLAVAAIGGELYKRRPGAFAQATRGIKAVGNAAGKALNPVTAGGAALQGLSLADIITRKGKNNGK